MEQTRGIIKLDFNVTNRCNLRCYHCCFESGTCLTSGEFSLSKIEAILKEFVSLGGKRIDITGGEPLMRLDIDKIIEITKNLGIKLELVTNGTLLSVDMLKRYREWGVEGIAISLDGSRYEEYSYIRHCANERMYQKVLSNIEAAAKLGFYTKVNTVVFDSNFHDLVNITNQVIDLGANEHGFYYFSPIGRGDGRDINVVDPLAWLELIRTELKRLNSQIKISLEVPIIETEISKGLITSCYLQDPWHLQILPDGNVYPCAIMAAHGRSLTNLYDRSLEEIWRSEGLWNDEYYNQNVKPLMDKHAGCVNYPQFNQLVRSGKYKFVCLCSKYSIEDLML